MKAENTLNVLQARMLLLCFLFVFAVPSVIHAVKNSTKPHIIFILADDLGFNDVSFHGSQQIPTPNIDNLANSGVILNNYYVQHICTPTRSSIMTGRYPIHTGMQHGVVLAAQPYGLSLNETILPQYLKAQGYQTHGVGKWHLGFFKTEYTPTKRGFDSFYGYWCGKEDYWDHSNDEVDGWGLDLRNGTEPVWTEWGRYSTDLFTAKAIDIIQNHDPSQPLFLYLPYQAVHVGNAITQPLQAPLGLIHKFADIQNEGRRVYAAMLTSLDMAVGKVVEAVKARGLYDNSVIIFSTDNGGPAAGFDYNQACNYPLRGVKATLWEGGVRGAAAVHSPLLGMKGRVSMEMMHVADWLPTLYGLAGGDVHSLPKIDGFDMWDALSHAKESPRQAIVHNIDPLKKWEAAIRYKQWKLLANISTTGSSWYPPPGYDRSNNSITNTVLKNAVVKCDKPPVSPPECTHDLGPCLFNIDEDPCEHVDQATKYPDVLDRMLKLLEQYKQSMVPPRNKPFDPKANPDLHGGLWSAWKDGEEDDE